MKIVWDEPKRNANIEKHGFDFADLDEAFFAGALIRDAHSGRYEAIGYWPTARLWLCSLFSAPKAFQ